MNDTCKLCEVAAGDTEVKVLTGQHWYATRHLGAAAPGWVCLATRRHVESLADLDPGEAVELGPALQRLAGAIRRAVPTGQVYSYSMGSRVRHVHILVGPPAATEDGAGFLSALLSRRPDLLDLEAATAALRRIAAELSAPSEGQEDK
jgi:diadenosine tetraphosphate (Ap4A) HIT family hydrolase